MQLLIYLLLPFLAAAWYTDEPERGVLQLQVGNIEVAQGRVWVGVYDSEDNFLVKEKAIVQGKAVARAGELYLAIDQVKYGNCAVAVFHDINGNGELDRNWLGIPTEPYAFSRKPPSKWRLPRFWEVAFAFSPQQRELSVVLDRW